MYVYIINLTIVYLSSLFARVNIKTKQFEEDPKTYNNIFIFIALSSLILVAGLRYYVGTDYGTYRGIYSNAPNVILNKETSEIGFIILCKFLHYITSDPQIMFLVTSIITYTCIVITLKNKSNVFELSMYLFITTYMYYSSLNVLRQWIASAIIFTGIQFLIDRNWKKYFLIVIIASLFHTSALIMIPIYFIVNHKFISKKNLIIISVFASIFIFYSGFLEVFFEFLEGSKYSNYQAEFIHTDRGVNILRVLVYICPILVAFVFYNNINYDFDKEVDIIMNLSLINMLMMVISYKHAYFARLCILFDPYYLLLIPKFLNLGDKKLNRIIYYVIIISYFAFSYSLLVAGDAGVINYKWRLIKFYH